MAQGCLVMETSGINAWVPVCIYERSWRRGGALASIDAYALWVRFIDFIEICPLARSWDISCPVYVLCIRKEKYVIVSLEQDCQRRHIGTGIFVKQLSFSDKVYNLQVFTIQDTHGYIFL